MILTTNFYSKTHHLKNLWPLVSSSKSHTLIAVIFPSRQRSTSPSSWTSMWTQCTTSHRLISSSNRCSEGNQDHLILFLTRTRGRRIRRRQHPTAHQVPRQCWTRLTSSWNRPSAPWIGWKRRRTTCAFHCFFFDCYFSSSVGLCLRLSCFWLCF